MPTRSSRTSRTGTLEHGAVSKALTGVEISLAASLES